MDDVFLSATLTGLFVILNDTTRAHCFINHRLMGVKHLPVLRLFVLQQTRYTAPYAAKYLPYTQIVNCITWYLVCQSWITSWDGKKRIDNGSIGVVRSYDR